MLFNLLYRSLVKPLDLFEFDELISPHEMKALRKKASDSEESDTVSIEYEYEYKDELEENIQEEGMAYAPRGKYYINGTT